MSKNKSILYLITVLVIGGVVSGMVLEGVLHVLERQKYSNKPMDTLAVKWPADFKIAEIESPVDGVIQKAFFRSTTSTTPQPLVVSLHSWSFDFNQPDSLAELSLQKNINYIHPDFRGINKTVQACCSSLALSDIDNAIDYAIAQGNVDTTRIYVIGRSGGGYATLSFFMKSKHNVRKYAAWVPLTDLVQWYDETKIRKLPYADDILICTGSPDGELNEKIAIERSPIFWETPVEKLHNTTVEIYAGVYDGLEGNGPIPISHSINFYNKILADLHVLDTSLFVTDHEKLRLLEYRKPLGDFGAIQGRAVCLKKEYKNLKIIIFSGGHEMLSAYALNSLLAP